MVLLPLSQPNGSIPIRSQSQRMGGMANCTEGNADVTSRFIVAVDFGTTFSSVAYARITKEMEDSGMALQSDDVKCISGYPHDPPLPDPRLVFHPREDVPTELWYPTGSPNHTEVSISGNEVESEGEEAEEEEKYDTLPTSPDSIPLSDDDMGFGDEDEEPLLIATKNHLYWGFGVQERLSEVDIPKDGAGRIRRFKLMLDERSETTKELRDGLIKAARRLRRAKIISHKTDIFSDYLTELFKHTKSQLHQTPGFYDDTPIEFVLCVPAL